MVCVSPRLWISKCVYVSWGLYVFLNEIDVYLWWRCCPLYWPNGMGSSPLTLEWIDKPAHTVVLSCGKNGLWLCVVHQHISKARSVWGELALGDRQKSQSWRIHMPYLSSRPITVGLISTACFSHLLFNCKRVGLLISTFLVSFASGEPWIREYLLHRWALVD